MLEVSGVVGLPSLRSGIPTRMNFRQVLDRSLVRWERSGRIEQIAERVQPSTARLLDRQPAMDVLSRRSVGHLLHPFVVQVPIGCWTAVALLDLLQSSVAGSDRRNSARILAGAGVVGAIPSVVSGAAEWVHTREGERNIGVVHASANALETCFYAASWWARRRQGTAFARSLSFAGLAIASFGGWLGGHLAYVRGVGINTSAFLSTPRGWTPAVARNEVPIGGIAHAVVDNVHLVLSGSGIGPDGAPAVSAFQSRCTHRGAPLHEGKVEGSCVRCPWHGSLSELTSGKVRRGPASMNQLAYVTRIVGDTVEVKSDDCGSLRQSVV